MGYSYLRILFHLNHEGDGLVGASNARKGARSGRTGKGPRRGENP